MIVALVDDFFFNSKISETAKQLQRSLKVVTSRDALLKELESGPDQLIVDLNFKNCDPVELIREIRQRGHATPILAFLSHVQGDLAKAAQQAGCNKVMARSYFSAHLPAILGRA